MSKNIITKFTKFFLIFPFFFLGGQFLSQNTYASICDNQSNASIKYACETYTGSGRRGMMWISDSNDKYDTSQEVRVNNWQEGDGSVDVYLHGAVFGASAPASSIKLVKHTDKISGTANSFSNYAPLENVPEKIPRPGNSRTQNYLSSSAIEIQLNIDELIKVEGDNYEDIDGYRKYTIVLQAFRCFGNKPLGSSGCYSDSSTLVVYVQVGTKHSPSDITIETSRNNSSNWTSEDTYVKPTDMMYFKGTYRPDAQDYADYTGTGIRTLVVEEGNSIKCSKDNNNPEKTVSQLFRRCSGLKKWNNAFSIYLSDNITNNFSELNIKGKVGDSSIYNNIEKGKERSYKIDVDDVGERITATAATNHNDSTRSTPTSVTTEYAPIEESEEEGAEESAEEDTEEKLDYIATVDISPIEATADILVPYNFTNTTDITTDDKTFFAGETGTINFDVTVGRRQNNAVGGNYATIVRNAKWGLELCYNYNNEEICQKTSKKGTLNKNGKLEGVTEDKQLEFNIPDVAAGTEICLRSMVYPASSGSDKNLDPKGSNTWAYSEQKCFTVAKKPSLQVWGGNIYSNSKITTNIATKRHLNGYNDYGINVSRYDSEHLFGSWGELGVISNGPVSKFASGAALGYADNGNNGSLIPNPYNGFYNEKDNTGNDPGGKSVRVNDNKYFCKLSPLTFANDSCKSGAAGLLGNSTSTNSMKSDKQSVMNKLVGAEIEEENRTVPGESIFSGTKVYSTTKDITITGDLTYDGEYKTLEEVPKFVIYAGGNINISCDVNRIDGLLIAEETVNTCADSNGDSPGINDRRRSNQLTVNGAIIAKKLLANRTYGAATGANSIVPAEIINFDSTLYLFGNSGSGESKGSSTNLDVIYMKELPPRY